MATGRVWRCPRCGRIEREASVRFLAVSCPGPQRGPPHDKAQAMVLEKTTPAPAQP